MNYLLHLLIYLSIYAILALSLNMVVGYCGLLTLSHAAYFAIGSYVYAVATVAFGWTFIPAIALGIGLASILSLLVALPAWRLKGDFFVMVSLAAQVLFFSAIYNWTSSTEELGTWANMTNGPFGISGVPKPNVFGISCNTIGAVSAFAAFILAISLAISWSLLRSPWGRVLEATRDDELAARALGKNVRLLKLQVFAISCAMAAIAGTLYASYTGFVDPTLASLDTSILLLCMVIVGGTGNVYGPLVGSAVLLGIPEALRFIDISDTMAADIRLIAYGLLLVIMVHFRPQGLAGRYRLE